MGSLGHRQVISRSRNSEVFNRHRRLLENALGTPGSDGYSGSQFIGNKTPKSHKNC